jgi:large subunit ribosomal protein L2
MIKELKPTNKGRRNMSVTDYSLLTSKKPVKALTKSLKRSAGRDKTGQISVRHQGGGEKRKYRIISSLDKCLGKKAKVVTLEYDPNRSTFIALVKFEDEKQAYVLAWDKIKVGQEVICQAKTDVQLGNRMQLDNIPNGIAVFDVEMKPGQGGKMVRSAGSQATITAKEGDYVNLKMPSGEVRKISKLCYATIGQASNITHSLETIGKAGRVRHMGIRPSVRGKAMHPDAHPHGGGEGNNPIGLKYPKTPWGKHAFGVRTRKKNKYSDKMIVKKRKK